MWSFSIKLINDILPTMNNIKTRQNGSTAIYKDYKCVGYDSEKESLAYARPTPLIGTKL